ncbi:MAG: hypothetical protein P8177_06405, partial [Gemmatimonadota bacterium]
MMGGRDAVELPEERDQVAVLGGRLLSDGQRRWRQSRVPGRTESPVGLDGDDELVPEHGHRPVEVDGGRPGHSAVPG